MIKHLLTASFITISLAAFAADESADKGYGTNPVLPRPDESTLPRVHTADAIG